jgi:P pilus assembly chaperone PapD
LTARIRLPVRAGFLAASAFVALALSSMESAATMQLERNIVYLQPGGPPRADLRIANPDKETLFVEVEVLEVRNPGRPDEERIPVRDPGAVDFLVTPNRFIVAPGSRQVVRFVNTGGHGNRERMFRVNFKPVSPPMEATEHAVRLVVGYQVLVVIAPEQPKPELTVERSGNLLRVTNVGNSSVLLRNGMQCESEAALEARDEDACLGITARRVYPGNLWETELPYSTPVEFTLSDVSGARRERY